MKICKSFLLLLLILSLSCNNQPKKINGISFVASGDSLQQKHVAPLVNIHTNFVALMPFGFISDLKSPEIRYNSKRQWFGETAEGIDQYAKEFKKVNIQVMLKPHIWVRRGTYTGFIEMETEEEWMILENSYESFILDFAKIAQKIGADILCIGTELEKFVAKRPAFWDGLIVKIREVYKGKLTYAANWDEFKRVPFWEKLDFIGIDAYFPLTDKKSPSVLDFEHGWKDHKSAIKNIQQKFNKPILFTEYGYRSVDYNGEKPWESTRVEGSVNHIAQKNAIQAIHHQFWNEKWFAGGFLWKWFLDHEKVGGEKNNRFTPQNKPVENFIKEFYK